MKGYDWNAPTIAYFTRVYHGPGDATRTQTTQPITHADLQQHGVNTAAELVARWNEGDPTRWTYYLER